MALCLKKIVSGGQTGADRGALTAARELGFQTGGVAPKGWLTETGPQEALLRGFGLIECVQSGYPARTRSNVVQSDGTLLVGPYDQGGSRLTFEIVTELKKPVFFVDLSSSHDFESESGPVVEFRDWIEREQIQMLNVAGSRESQNPGIAEFTRRFLLRALREGSQ